MVCLIRIVKLNYLAYQRTQLAFDSLDRHLEAYHSSNQMKHNPSLLIFISVLNLTYKFIGFYETYIKFVFFQIYFILPLNEVIFIHNRNQYKQKHIQYQFIVQIHLIYLFVFPL